VVLLAILALVGVFVVGPDMAQHMMDNTIVTLENATMVPKPGDLVDGTWADLYVVSTLGLSTFPGPFGATIVPYQATMSTNGVDFGYFDFPKTSIKVGDNAADFRANFTITNASAVANWTNIWLKSDPDAIISLGVHGVAKTRALGLLFKPKQHVALWCKQLAGGPAAGLSMKCTKEYPSPSNSTAGNKTTPSSNAQATRNFLDPLKGSGAAAKIQVV